MSAHKDFILTPITEILDEAANATHCVQQGIDIYPLSDYIMQSIFIKMTGAQEQKMKCICWDISTYDFEARYSIYHNWSLGECSSLSDKNKILGIIINSISKNDTNFDPAIIINRNDIIAETKQCLKRFFENSGINEFSHREYYEFDEIFNAIVPDCIYQIDNNPKSKQRAFFRVSCNNCSHKNEVGKPFTCGSLKNLSFMYEKLYAHRNRCAHNLMSYQQNLPSLKTLNNIDYMYENYYIRFALLIIIDIIITKLYKLFIEQQISTTGIL